MTPCTVHTHVQLCCLTASESVLYFTTVWKHSGSIWSQTVHLPFFCVCFLKIFQIFKKSHWISPFPTRQPGWLHSVNKWSLDLWREKLSGFQGRSAQIRSLKSLGNSESLVLSSKRAWGFPGGSMVKNLPPVQEIQIQSLEWEDPLEKGMTTCSSILAWRIPCTEEPAGLQSMGLQRVRHDLVTE